jgi:hypothetical protein
MRYWWVNQNQTYRAELRGSFMWSPKQNANGARNQFYENMREVSPGDIVFSFCDTRIKALGVVTGGAQTGPKPDFGAAGSNWSREGWFVPVDYCVLNNQIRRSRFFRARRSRRTSRLRLWTRASPDRRSKSSLSERGVVRVCSGRTSSCGKNSVA